MVRSRRITVLVAALCVALAAMAGVAVAKPHGGKRAKPAPGAGQLDPSFGRGGKIVVSTPQSAGEAPVEMATAPSGKSYVLDGSLLLAFGADGKPDRGFGQNGRLEVATATGLTTKVTDLTVDADGRILVTGSFEPTPGAVNQALPIGELTGFSPKQPISDAFVIRYLPTGERDASFGAGGEIDATLEVPPPTGPYPGDTLHYEKPVVYSNRIAVVEGDQPVIGGSYTYSATYCYFLNVPAFAFTARLDSSGPGARSLPASAYTNVPSTSVSALAPAPDGLGVLSNNASGCPLRGVPEETTASQLTVGGTLAPGLDPSRPRLPNLVGSALALDGTGRMLVAEGSGPYATTTSWKLIRLLPNGDFDTAFGASGGLPLTGFGAEPVASIVTDARSRVLVGGGSHRFRVIRIGTKAKVDRSFGNHGWAEAGFGKGTEAHLAAMTVDAKGRIVAAGQVASSSLKTGVGIGLVRFLPGR